MAKALLGHVRGPDQRMAAELRRLRQRVGDLEAQLARSPQPPERNNRGRTEFPGSAG